MSKNKDRVHESNRKKIMEAIRTRGGTALAYEVEADTGVSVATIANLVSGLVLRGLITTSGFGASRVIRAAQPGSGALPFGEAPKANGYWTDVDNAISFLCGVHLAENPAASVTIGRAAKMIRDDRAAMLAEIQRLSPTVADAAVEATAPTAKVNRMREYEGRARIVEAVKAAPDGLTSDEVCERTGLSESSCKSWLRNAVSAGVLSVIGFRESRNVYGLRA